MHATDNISAVYRCSPSTQNGNFITRQYGALFSAEKLVFVIRPSLCAIRFVLPSRLLRCFSFGSSLFRRCCYHFFLFCSRSLTQNFAFASVTNTHTNRLYSSSVSLLYPRKCCSSAPSGLFDITRLLSMHVDCSDGSVVQFVCIGS